MTGKNIVFGKVVSGMEIIRKFEHIPVDENERPLKGEEPAILNCGELIKKKNENIAKAESRTETATGVTVGQQLDKKVEEVSTEVLEKERNLYHQHTKRSKYRDRDRSPRDEHRRRSYLSHSDSGRDSRRDDEEYLRRAELRREMERDGVRIKGRGKMKFRD